MEPCGTKEAVEGGREGGRSIGGSGASRGAALTPGMAEGTLRMSGC